MPDCTYFLVPELTEPGRGAEVCLVSKRMFIPDDTPVLVEKYYILTRRNKRTLNMVACSATSVESCLCLKALRAFPKGIPMLVGMAPGFQQRENRVLHLLGRIAGREEPLHVRLIQEKLLTLIGLLLGEQGMQVVLRQCASLAHLFKSAGLYKGWRGLAKLHFSLQPTLVLRRHVGNLYRGVECHPGFVDHLQDGGDEVGQADVALDLVPAFSNLFSQNLTAQLRPNLGRS